MNQIALLLYPRWWAFRNSLRKRERNAILKLVVMVVMALLFWAGSYVLFSKLMAYFGSVDVFGELLAKKLLFMIFLTLFSILLFSNVITALSTFFLSDDLPLIFSSPVPLEGIYITRYSETLLESSWMVTFFALPIFVSYGVVMGAPWIYYPTLAAVILPFLMIPSALGTIITMLLVNVFPAKRIKDILFLMIIVLVIILYLLIRFLQPEKLVNPEAFSNLVEYLSVLRMPKTQFLPSHWATEVLAPLAQRSSGSIGFYLLMLVSTALGLLAVGNMVARRIYFYGFSKAQEAHRIRLSRNWFMDAIIGFFSRPFHLSTRAVIEKDIKIFFRDTSQWSQLLLLAALVVVYLYNFSVLPLDKAPIAKYYTENLFSFLNMGLAGFVISAIAARFVFPAVSLEGDFFWLIRSSPLTLKRLFWSKFWTAVVPLAVLSQLLIVLSNHLLQATTFLRYLSSMTVLGMTFGIVATALGLGAVYPKFKAENVTKISTSYGGIVYMITSMAFISAVVMLEAWPTYLVIASGARWRDLGGWEMAQIAISFGTAVLICIAAVAIPMKRGLVALKNVEL
jgi:ABC-2 type transport system permease protein